MRPTRAAAAPAATPAAARTDAARRVRIAVAHHPSQRVDAAQIAAAARSCADTQSATAVAAQICWSLCSRAASGGQLVLQFAVKRRHVRVRLQRELPLALE